MKLRDLLANWGLSNLKLNAGFLEAEFVPRDEDRTAAWDLYIELITRIAVRPLGRNEGVPEAALKSLVTIFGSTRETLKKHGPGCVQFSRIAVAMLSQVLAPVTAKWHARLVDDKFASAADANEFRDDLERLQPMLTSYARALADLAGVEDLTMWAAPKSQGRKGK